jgi:colicin import membrane protein
MLVEAEILQPETSSDIVLAVQTNPGIVLLDAGKFDAFYDKWKAKGDALTADVSTNKGRDALRSFASDLRKEKAAIDKARLRLTEEWRGMVTQANDAGKVIKERLENLAVEVRAPLTAWEEAEEARIADCRFIISALNAAKVIDEDDTADSVRTRGMQAYETELNADQFGDMLAEAQAAKDEAIATLKRALARLTQEEADRDELARLRAEKDEAERLAAQMEAAAQMERDRLEAARVAEAAKLAAKEAEAAKIKAAEQAAAQAVQDAENAKAREADNKRFYARSIIDHINQVGLGMIGGQKYPYGILLHELTEKIVIDDDLGDMQDEVRSVRDATLKSVEAAMELASERARRKDEAADAKRLADEQAEREANKANRTRVKSAAKHAIMTCGVSEDAAQKVVLAIIAGEIPAVSLRF